MVKKDYYVVLGLSRDCSQEEIKRAFRRDARKYHPDVNPGDKVAEAKFKDINEAYETLGDVEKRADYDAQLQRIVLSAAEAFNGTVYPFSSEDGRIIRISFPAGVAISGENVRVEGKSIPVVVDFAGTLYQVRKDGLEYLLPLSISEVRRGGKLENIPTPWGAIVFTIPPAKQIGGTGRLTGIGWPIKTNSSRLTEKERQILGINPSVKPFWLSASQLKAIGKVGNLYIRTELVADDYPLGDWSPYSPTTLLLKA